MTAWGASTLVHWCTACQLTFSAWSSDSETLWTGGRPDVPMRPRGAPQDHVDNVHIHTFIERRLRDPHLGEAPFRSMLARRAHRRRRVYACRLRERTRFSGVSPY